jgi:D-alanine-D-alanine ligase
LSGDRVGLLFGGRSVEHEVSVTSARGVARALAAGGFEAVPIGVTGDGRWLDRETSLRVLEGSAARVEAPPGAPTRLVLDPGGGALLRLAEGDAPQALAFDVLFPVIHGWGGEDGRLQGALEIAGIPYVGSGVLASALAMDKAVAREVLSAHEIPAARWLQLNRYDGPTGRPLAERVARELGWPAFVKPANGGSSVGVSRVSDPRGLIAAVDLAFAHDDKVVIEEGLDAREIECAVLGNERPEASILGEIVPSGEFYDYAAKYLDGTSELKIPADLEPGRAAEIRELALAAYRALGLAGFARVDFLLDRTSGRVVLNEVNTLPGFTPISMFPMLWEASGLGFPGLVARLVRLAQERWQRSDRLRTRWMKEG